MLDKSLDRTVVGWIIIALLPSAKLDRKIEVFSDGLPRLRDCFGKTVPKEAEGGTALWPYSCDIKSSTCKELFGLFLSFFSTCNYPGSSIEFELHS